MLLQDKQGTLIKILDIDRLIDPNDSKVPGKIQEGQEEQEPEEFSKQNLEFPSGEILPLCWLDANYQLKPNRD